MGMTLLTWMRSELPSTCIPVNTAEGVSTGVAFFISVVDIKLYPIYCCLNPHLLKSRCMDSPRRLDRLNLGMTDTNVQMSWDVLSMHCIPPS